MAAYPWLIRCIVAFTDLGDPLCSGLALVEGTALWVGFLGRRSPKVWGFGRLTWAITFFVVIAASLEEVVWCAARGWMSGGPESGGPGADEPYLIGAVFQDSWDWFLSYSGDSISNSSLPVCLAGLLITSLVARFPRDPAPDAREWAGRVFFGFVSMIYLSHRTLAWYWE